MDLLTIVEQDQIKTDLIEFRPGDTVRVHVKLIEGNRQRIQVFEGIVIGIHKGKARSTFTVRKVSYGVGVERIFPLHSRIIDKIEVVRSGRVRRAKLFYLRSRVGKKARVKELRKTT
ncbi:MAG: 50S ribosomal protein L19 [bacterium]